MDTMKEGDSIWLTLTRLVSVLLNAAKKNWMSSHAIIQLSCQGPICT